MDWIKLLEEIKNKRGWSIRQLAGDLGVSQAYLNDVMRGVRKPSPLQKAKILDRYGYNFTTELIIELLPDDAAQIVKKAIDDQIKKIAEKADKRMDKLENGDKET